MRQRLYDNRIMRVVIAFFCVITVFLSVPGTFAAAASAGAAGAKTGNLTFLYGIVFALSVLLFFG